VSSRTHLDQRTYGTLAEIGAAREVARWFFQDRRASAETSSSRVVLDTRPVRFLASGPANGGTLGLVKRLVTLLVALVLGAAAGTARAQIIPPLPVGGPAQGALQQLHPPSPLEQVREQALRRSAPLALPPPPSERWVPEQQRFAPELGRNVVIPGHYEERITDQQYSVPPLPATDRTTGVTVTIPGGQRPPAELRQAP